MFPQHHFQKKLSYRIQYWLCKNCGRVFVWEMTYSLGSSNSSGWGGGDILLIKIKIQCCSAGQNLEVMTFRYLKTLVLDKFFENYIIWYFHFWVVLFVIINPLFMIIRLCLPIYPYSFQKNLHKYKKFWRFHQIPLPPIVQAGMIPWDILSMLFLIVFRFTVMDFIWMREPSIFKKNEQNEKVQNFEEFH